MTMKPKRRPTQQDVAELAGVTRGTVSIVLNDRTDGSVKVSEETRQRILDAARALGYSLNPVAQMLAKAGRNQVIAVFSYESVFPYELENNHFPYLLGIEREASQQGFDVLCITNHANQENHGIYTRGTNRLRLADGAIILGVQPDHEELRRLADEGFPFVYIGRREIEGLALDWVVTDYQESSFTATRHLLDLDHKSILYVGHSPNTEAAQDKLLGCERAIRESPNARLLVAPEGFLSDPQAAIGLLAKHEITAIICRELPIFMQTYDLVSEHGLSVPDDISILSLAAPDTIRPMALYPTYVYLAQQKVGELAVKTLMGRLDHPFDQAQHLFVKGKLIVGDSTTRANLERMKSL
jgi:DNA-binding LacI/PurR family transcriptional regulator